MRIVSTFALSLAVILDSIEESSHLHIRKKRLIHLDKDFILSAVLVLAPGLCVIPSSWGSLRSYTILSRSNSRNSGFPHSIQRRILVEPNTKLVLLKVSPPFYFHRSPNRPISIFLGVVPQIAYGIFSSWGCTQPENLSHTAVYPEELRQTRLYIIALEECIRIYRGRRSISDRAICTLDTTKRRGTCIGDLGGPLVVQFPPLQAPHLLGVMSNMRGETFGEDPDIFINLNHHDINGWITHTINSYAIA